MKIYSVEIEWNSYNDDLFCGTYQECVNYCKEQGYTFNEDGARIALIDEYDGYCFDIIENWE